MKVEKRENKMWIKKREMKLQNCTCMALDRLLRFSLTYGARFSIDSRALRA